MRGGARVKLKIRQRGGVERRNATSSRIAPTNVLLEPCGTSWSRLDPERCRKSMLSRGGGRDLGA